MNTFVFIKNLTVYSIMVDLKLVEKNCQKLKTDKKYLFLAYDQGLEHGPNDLQGRCLDPDYLIEIANKSKIDGFICQKGIAEKFSHKLKKPLIIKVNGKQRLRKNAEPYSPINCSVDYAIDLGARAIGFTNFDGSDFDYKIQEDFRKIQEEAHHYGLPVISWMYPRGKNIKNKMDREVLAYSARIGLELGADFIKVPFNGNVEDLKYMKNSSKGVRLLIQGGEKAKTSREFLNFIKKTSPYCEGYAIGRNIFKHDKPIKLIKAIRDIQIDDVSVDVALSRLKED